LQPLGNSVGGHATHGIEFGISRLVFKNGDDDTAWVEANAAAPQVGKRDGFRLRPLQMEDKIYIQENSDQNHQRYQDKLQSEFP
jgi:hypothetical protein